MYDRRDFLISLGVAGATPSLLGAAPNPPGPEPLARALVLSGGGARGAYQAGIIGEMVAANGIKDGAPLTPYEIVCGTSIGALNGWFVATAQYTHIHDLWYGVSAEHVIQLKRRFWAWRNPTAGLIQQLFSTIQLTSLARNEVAVLDSQPVIDWIARNVDLDRPLVMPLVWATTNLTAQRPEYFFARAAGAKGELSDRIVTSLRLSLGPDTVVREAPKEHFHRALFASAAVPLVWDPVELPGVDGSPNLYCDGGVAANSPVSVAHSVASAADVVLLDPPNEEDADYSNAPAIALGMFGTMQRKILTNDMRSVYFQSVAKRAFRRGGAAQFATEGEPLLAKFVSSVPATDLTFIRPAKVLPLGTAAFDDQEGIGKAYRIGWNDAIAGFTRYDWQTFEA